MWATTQGADLLVGRSFQTSSGLSYQPIIHLLRQRIERENAPEDLLSDLWLAQLTRLLPELRDRYPDLPTPTIEENSARQHLFEAVTRLIQALAARKPLLLFIDDWHWADSGSLDLLHYAAGRWSEANLPILIVLTLRQEELSQSPDLQSWLGQINHATNCTLLQMGELSQQETTQLIEQLLPSKTDGVDEATQRFSDWLFAETDGQPLFLTETLKALVDDVLVQPADNDPSWRVDWSKFDAHSTDGTVLHGIQQIVQGWLARISPQAKGLLTAVSVLAQNATFDHLCHIAGLDEMDALNALDGLLAKQLLQEAVTSSLLLNPDPIYSFTHQKVSDVVYAEAGTARRRLLHRRAFNRLQHAATPAANLAHHALNAGLLAESVHHSLIAGNEAMDLFAVQVAIPHYQTIWNLIEQRGWPETLSGADKQTLFVKMGRAYELAEEWPSAQKTYEAMITEARAVGASAMEWLGLNRLAEVFIYFGQDQQQILTLLEQAYAIAEQNADRLGLAETDSSFAHVARMYDDLPLARSYAERALRVARELNHPQLMARQLVTLSDIHIQRREWDKA
jgi:predicted ATPase